MSKVRVLKSRPMPATFPLCQAKPRVAPRDNYWLLSRLNNLWSKYFSNVVRDNPIVIKFGRYSKYRLGSIKLHKHSGFSLITITGMFKDPTIPAEVVDHTIAHELVHYTHGFSSQKQRLHKYPHAGGIVRKEMAQRGMEYLNDAYGEWVKQYRKKLMED